MKKWTCLVCTLLLLLALTMPVRAAEKTIYPGPDSVLYYDQLTPTAQFLYNVFLEHAGEMADGKTPVYITFPKETKIKSITLPEYADAISAFSLDHSEIFWLDFSKLHLSLIEQMETDGIVVVGSLLPRDDSYLITPLKNADDTSKAQWALENGIKAALAGVDRSKSEYAQLRAIHDWLCKQNTYQDFNGTVDYRMYTALSALDQDASTMPVCEGYSRAFKLLCDALSIPCMLVEGDGVSEISTETHMWNIVRLGGVWYAVDVTWDDALGNDSFFLVGSDSIALGKKFSESHIADPVINYDGREFYYQTISRTAYVPPTENTDPQPSGSDGKIPEFQTVNTYKDGMFTDVKPGDWYRDNVAKAYELALMIGNGDGTFGVNGSVTVAQTITIAARLHAVCTGKTIPTLEGAWYEGYVRYALDNGIILSAYKDYNAPILRGEFAAILSRAMPAEALQPINDIKEGQIPDVAKGAEIYMLYRAGVLRGDVDGSFYPDTPIRRSEVAAIVTRMAVPALRVKFAL